MILEQHYLICVDSAVHFQNVDVLGVKGGVCTTYPTYGLNDVTKTELCVEKNQIIGLLQVS